MGLRCLIGHEYGEPETSRDRNERGSEVVVTVREYRECSRCGHRRLISENKEVTTEATGASSEEPAAEASWSAEPESEDQATVDAFAGSSVEPAGGHDEPMSAAEDDGIILDDDSEEPRRGRGEWPEASGDDEPEDEGSDEPEPWPDEGSGLAPDEPAASEPTGPDVDPLEAGPEPTGEPGDGSSATESGEETAEADATAEAAEPSPRPDNRNTEFVCPDCGETWPSRNASLRPGDICPDCRRGYLDERVVQ
jgi:DNA-directed RNA polymerase subunit RPC12/RpoP